MSSRYEDRGVSSDKKDVHVVVDKMDPGIMPGSFCKITEDYLSGDPLKCNITHSDGSGTKVILAYLMYKESGDASYFKGIAQDSIVMNLDDLICVGATDGIVISNTINRNKFQIGGDILSALIEGSEEFLVMLREQGIDIHSGGGETADVGDLVRTLTVDSCATAIMRKVDVVRNEIGPRLAIIGLSSTGRATYESSTNSGIGSNGLTSARHDLLGPNYKRLYPETVDTYMPDHLVYTGGDSCLQNNLPGRSDLTIGDALLSPTRTYAPIIKQVLKEFRSDVQGLVHCSGGGQTKCLRFGKNVHFVKENMFDLPDVFRAIFKTGIPWEEMYTTYNMGHRMEIYAPIEVAVDIQEIAQDFGVTARVIGYTEASDRNHLTIKNHGVEYKWEMP